MKRIVFALVLMVASGYSTEIFTEFFESGLGNWTSSGTWATSATDALNVTSARCSTCNSLNISNITSLAGYFGDNGRLNITFGVSVWNVDNTPPPEGFFFWYYNGSVWNNSNKTVWISGTNPDYVYYNYTIILPRANVSNFQMRFMCNVSASTESCIVDDIRIHGTTMTVDSTAPNIGAFKYNVTNSTNYSSTQGYQFNVTVADTTGVGNVWIEHNFSGILRNYSVTGNVGSSYYYNNASLGSGFYYVKWYANDTLGNLNNTDLAKYYQVNRSAGSVSLRLNGTLGDITMLYGTKTNASGASGYGAFALYRNGSAVTSENDTYVTLAGGYYNYTASSAGNQNYTAVNISRFVTVNKANQIMVISYNPSTSFIYGLPLNASGSGNMTVSLMYRNGTEITNMANYTLSAGSYNYTWNNSGNENYTANSTSNIVTVAKANQIMALVVTPSLNEVYGTATTATGSGNWTLSDLYRNGTVVTNGEIQTLAVGHYNYTFNNSGNENYTANTTSVKLIITKAPSRANLLTMPVSPVMYGIASNFSCWLNVSFAPTLYLNTTDITSQNGSYIVRGAGVYLVNCTWAGNENYTGSENSSVYVIDKANQIMNIDFDPDQIITYGTSITIFGNGNWTLSELYKNSTLISSPYIDVLAGGSHNFTWNNSGNENYTANSTSGIVTVNKAVLPATLYINGTDGDVTLDEFSDANFTANFSSGNIFVVGIWSNLTGVFALEGSGVSPLTVIKTLDVYNKNIIIKANWSENENYTHGQVNHTLAIRCITGPSISDFKYNVTNESEYSPFQGYQFNATVTDEVGVDTVWVEHNFTGILVNYTVSANVSSEYYYDYGTLGAGYYYIKWYANCTDGAENTTNSVHYYQVNQSYLPLALYINNTDGDVSLFNDSVSNFTANFTGGIIFPITLYTNLSGAMELWDTQNSPLTNYTDLSPYQVRDGYLIIANFTNGNYSYAQANHTLNLTSSVPPKDDSLTTLAVTPPSPIIYGIVSNFSCSNNMSLYTDLFVNETNKTSEMNLDVVRGAGTYNLTCVSYGNDTTNGANDSILYVIIQRSQNLTLNASPGINIVYETSLTMNGSGNYTAGTLYKNGTIVTNPYTNILAVGSHNFTWSVIGDDNNTANSTETIVTVNRANQILTLSFNPSAVVDYGTNLIATGNGNLTGAELYRNGTLITNGAGYILSAGDYNFTWNNSGNENYTANSTSAIATVNKVASLVTLIVAPSSPIIYGTASNFSCSLNVSFQPILWRNTTNITSENNIYVVRAVGVYLVNCTWPGNENYTGSEDTAVYAINKANQILTIGFNPGATITYGTSLTVTANGNSMTSILYMNETEVTNPYTNILAAGSYNFTWNNSGNENYTANSTSDIVIVNKAPQILTLALTPSATETYGTQTIATGSGNMTLANLYRNDSAKSNPNTVTLGAGAYQYIWNTTENENYSANTTNALLTINKNSSVITLWINGTIGNRALYNNSDVNFTARLDQGAYSIMLWTNLMGAWGLWDTQDSPLMNYTNLMMYPIGSYIIKANWTGNENYTSTQANHTLMLQFLAPPPVAYPGYYPGPPMPLKPELVAEEKKTTAPLAFGIFGEWEWEANPLLTITLFLLASMLTIIYIRRGPQNNSKAP